MSIEQQGNALMQFLAFMEPLTAPSKPIGVASPFDRSDVDGVLTSGQATRGVFAGGAVITQNDIVAPDAAVARAMLPTAA
jgi:hypothetical protein